MSSKSGLRFAWKDSLCQSLSMPLWHSSATMQASVNAGPSQGIIRPNTISFPRDCLSVLADMMEGYSVEPKQE